MIILQILITIYIVMALLISIAMTVAIIKIGGFQEIANRANMIKPPEVKTYTSIQVQWLVVTLVLFWPYYACTLRLN